MSTIVMQHCQFKEQIGREIRGFPLTFSIHHLGVAVQDIEKAAAFYLRCFGYQLASGVIHDPRQEAYVQFLRFPGDRTYLELVQPQGPGSKLSQAIIKGGGLNHVCYATDDIEAACQELRACGLFLIAAPVPAVAFKGRRIAWLIGKDRVITELVERGQEDEL
jgi:methylmalonyl-CoA/ethylmalonyl-CoA epimerase